MDWREDVTSGGVVVLYLSGEIDLASRASLTAALSGAMTTARSGMILDLDQVSFMDSTGLHALVRAHNSMKVSGLPLVLSRIDSVKRVLEVSGLSDFFSISPNVEQALIQIATH